MAKILIIDDNKEITEMLAKYLIMKKYQCDTSNDGMEGLKLIKTKSHDHVILDITMPDFSGHDIINALEKENLLKNQKITILTASDIKQETIDTLINKKGITIVLKKPVKLKKILSVIAN